MIKDNMPLYEQVYQTIKRDIQSGLLKSGDKLLSKRRMSYELGVSINTVDAAYSLLESEGYIYTLPKSGSYVSKIDELQHIELKSEALAGDSARFDYDIDFSPSDVDTDSFPYAQWRKLLRQAFDEEDGLLLKSPDVQGDFRLRRSICSYLSQSRGIDANPDNLIIGTGTGSLLRCICGMMGKNRVLATENPVYNRAYAIFSAMGGACLSIDGDDLVGNLLRSDGEIFYVTPSHQFPLGYSLPVSTRVALLNWAGGKEGRYIIEDDYDSEFRYVGKPLSPMKSMDRYGKVIYIGTFSKCIAPSLKISYALLPDSLMAAYRRTADVYASSVSRLEQNVLNQFMESGSFERHLNKMRNIYRKKRELLVSLLSEHREIEILGENAGHHILIKLPRLSEDEMVELARSVKVKVYPVSRYFVGGPSEKYSSSVLLGYGALSADKIAEGVERLMDVWGV